MALTAREWLLLPLAEQDRRKEELSAREYFLLRTELAHIHFSEAEKEAMSLTDKKAFLTGGNTKAKEVQKMRQKQQKIWQDMIKDVFPKKYEEEKK